MLQGLAYFKEGYDATQQIRIDDEARFKVFLDQAIAKKYQALEEKRKAEENLREIEETMDRSMKQLEEQMRASLASAEEKRIKEFAEKNAAISELSRALMDQGHDLLTANGELKQLRAEVEELRESTRSRTASLATAEAERDELKGRLHQEARRASELQRLVDIWLRREGNLPQTVVAKYVQSAEFMGFVNRLTVGAFRMGALEFWEAVLRTQPLSTVEATDEHVPAYLAEATLSTVPPPPKFQLSPTDLDRNVDPKTFEDPPEAEEKGEDEEEEAIEGETTTGIEEIPADEPSILEALAEDPLDPPSPKDL